MIMSQQAKPRHRACFACGAKASAHVGLMQATTASTSSAPPTIQNMVKPRSTSSDTSRSVGRVSGCGSFIARRHTGDSRRSVDTGVVNLIMRASPPCFA